MLQKIHHLSSAIVVCTCAGKMHACMHVHSMHCINAIIEELDSVTSTSYMHVSMARPASIWRLGKLLINVTQNGSSSGLVSRCCRASSCRPSYLVSVGEVESGTRPSRLGVCQFCEVPSRPTLTLITLSGSQSDNGEEKKKKGICTCWLRSFALPCACAKS